jgi:hypothetical protein
MKSKRNQKEKVTQKRPKVLKVGIQKKTTIFFWVLLIISTSFGIYKNFTAIDIHTIHEREIIERQIVDTNQVESFVSNFAYTYYSWQQDGASIDMRNEQLKQYLTDELQQLNVDMIRNDIPTSASVHKVQILEVKQDKEYFDVVFSVTQLISEDESNRTVYSAYYVRVYMDTNHDMVIIKNPTITNLPNKAEYTTKQTNNEEMLDMAMTEEIKDFLETFFKLYPTATEKELAYYVGNQILKPIHKDYIFVELVNPIYSRKGDTIVVSVGVKYLDEETKATQISQFDLTLEKQGNWKIIK